MVRSSLEEGTYNELNFRKKKWLPYCTYNPNKINIIKQLDVLRRSLDFYSVNYKNLIIIKAVNMERNQEYIRLFCETFSLADLIKEPTCFKNQEN